MTSLLSYIPSSANFYLGAYFHGIRASIQIFSGCLDIFFSLLRFNFEFHKPEQFSQGFHPSEEKLYLPLCKHFLGDFAFLSQSCDFIYRFFFFQTVMGGKSRSKILEKDSEASSSVVRVFDTPVQHRLVLPDLDMKYNGLNGQKWVTLAQRSLTLAL